MDSSSVFRMERRSGSVDGDGVIAVNMERRCVGSPNGRPGGIVSLEFRSNARSTEQAFRLERVIRHL